MSRMAPDNFALFLNLSNSTNVNGTGTATPQEEASAPIWALPIVSVLILVAVVANFLVIAAFFLEPRLRTPFNYYVLNLAVSDFLTGAIDMPILTIGYTYFGYWPYSDNLCTFWMYFDYTLPSVSVWTMVVLTADRMWAITWPPSYRRHNSHEKCWCAIAFCWLITNAANLPGYIYTRLYNENQTALRTCLWDYDGIPEWAASFWGYNVVNGWLPTGIAIVCYVVTVCQLGKVRRIVGPAGQRSARKIRDRQAFVVLTLLITTMIVLWLPWFVYDVRLTLLHYRDSDLFWNIAYWMVYSLSVVNPFMFNAGNEDMRSTVRMMCVRKKTRRVQQGTVSGSMGPTGNGATGTQKPTVVSKSA